VLRDTQHRGNSIDGIYRYILFASFHTSQVSVVHPRDLCQFLLTQFEYFSITSNVVPNDFSCIQSEQ